MKLKSHSASKKRFKISARGKVRGEKSSRKHLLINKSKRQKKSSRGGLSLFAGDVANIKKLLPYS